jgi:RNA polymerase sigma factor (TIGR02999 family)
MAKLEEITLLLREVESGREGALDELIAVVYNDLEQMARGHLHRHFGRQANVITLEPSALVHESFMRIIRQRTTYDDRGHFFAIATRIMLRVLIDYRRERAAAKRGGDVAHVTLGLDPADPGDGSVAVEVEELAAALQELMALDPRKADVVKMRVVWGLSGDETARSLGVSPATVQRDWRFARVWLADRVRPAAIDDTD